MDGQGGKDMLEQENARLARRLQSKSGAATGPPKKTPQQLEEEQRQRIEAEIGQGSVTVQLVNSHNHAQVLHSQQVVLDKGRIPLRSLMSQWQFKEPVIWVDADMPLGLMPDGYSDLTFAALPKVRLQGTLLS
ncbi:hypothetical protein QOT17_016178 [Balamuthia mandrillaris]